MKGCVFMSFGSFLKNLREQNKLSQRDLAEKSGVSNAEISRLETGDRKKPSPLVLKSLAPSLGIRYEELMQQAGYIEETIEHKGYTENLYRMIMVNSLTLLQSKRYVRERQLMGNLVIDNLTSLTDSEEILSSTD